MMTILYSYLVISSATKILYAFSKHQCMLHAASLILHLTTLNNMYGTNFEAPH